MPDPTDAARNVARQKLAGLFPGQTGINVADEIADAIEAAVREQVAREITGAATARLDAIDELDRKPSDQHRYQEWMDAAQIARGKEVSW